MGPEQGKYFVVDWTIKNFSCWKSGFHDKEITSFATSTVPAWWVKLYPGGLGGSDEHLVVCLYCQVPRKFQGDLSFIGPDGSLISTQQVDSKEEVGNLELPPGPKFEVVVAQIRKKEARHKDRLTVRWRMKSAVEIVDYMRTTIIAYDVFFKTSSEILDYSGESCTELSVMRYPFGEEKMDQLHLACGENARDRSKIALSLNPNRAFDSDIVWKSVFLRTRISVMSNEEVVRTEEKEHHLHDMTYWDFCDSLTREEVSKEGFSLEIYLKVIPSRKYKHGMSVYKEFPTSVNATPTAYNKPEDSVEVLTKELMCLFQDRDFSDFRLKCGDVTFAVHRAILSARCPVFKTMLSCDMKEAASGCMDIEDLCPSTLSLFLTYLYTGGVENLQGEGAIKLYYAAEKYQVPSLKRECVSVLCSSVSISNVCDILSLADKHHDDQLLSVAHEFLLSNYYEMLASEEWERFMRSEPLLAAETLTYFGVKKYVKRIELS